MPDENCFTEAPNGSDKPFSGTDTLAARLKQPLVGRVDPTPCHDVHGQFPPGVRRSLPQVEGSSPSDGFPNDMTTSL
jgi:hypothetical protein